MLGVEDGACHMLASLNITNADAAVATCNTLIPSLFECAAAGCSSLLSFAAVTCIDPGCVSSEVPAAC